MNFMILVMALTSGILNLNWSAENSPEIIRTPLGDRISITGIPSVGKPGAPLFPQVPLTAALPQGAVADSVRIVSTSSIPLSFNYHPMPAQMGVPISRPEDFRLTAADPRAFSTPVNASVHLTGQGNLMGYPVADLVLNPITWNPETKELIWTESMELQIYYHINSTSQAIPSRGITGSAIASSIVSTAVLNPADIPVAPASSTTDLPWGEYLIIADDGLAAAFEPLAEWKTQKGIPAKIVEMSFITNQYSGVDDAQKLRFFLYEIFQDSPPTYVLLAGDTPGVPHRNCYATAEGYTGDPSADLYYQDMNDTAAGVDAWNLDGDDIWGELNGNDNMDYHPDYILGRASVETVTEANAFVNKVIAWENSPDTDDWYNAMGFTTEVLWSSPYCPGSAGKEKVDNLYTPSSWTITKLYQSSGSQSYTATMAMLNTGMQLVNHAGHGSQSSVSIGSGSLGTSEFMGLTNVSQRGRPTIWNTIACLSGSFDTGTCLAEAWIRSPGGGGFCIMNTRYGWGEPAEPGDQWSELVDQEFFANFFVDDMYLLGVAYMMAKDDFISLIPSDTHYDWIAKSNTLFGDPELPMYSAVPEEMEIGDFFLCEGDENLTVNVTSGGSPLQNARVCLMQGDWEAPVTYAVGVTDATGYVTLSFDYLPATPNQVRLTVWARDHVLLTGMHDVGNMGVGDESQQTLPTLSLISSNPVQGTASIGWSIPESANGNISIIDLTGRTVITQELQGLEGLFIWQTQDSPAGLYFVRMTTSTGDILSTSMVVVR
ncbi:MAG: T9SS type A sorting domain-containing protein [Candidatus Sabulitectum sp.]|nr:T9SS type A sorting domain-containing protein [Candidatus Sabulitectum sp.]